MIDKGWIKQQAEEEIDGAKCYFKMAQEADDEKADMFMMMGRDELNHASNLYEMYAMMR